MCFANAIKAKSKTESALELASQGYFIFPILPNSKIPKVKFKSLATRDAETISNWWTCPVLGTEKDYNIGIYTGKFQIPSGALVTLLVVDIDKKDKKNGFDTAARLELEEGNILTPTATQTTPTGGAHYIYWHREGVRNGVSVLGPGLDVRSNGGYILGGGSTISGKAYSFPSGSVCEAPEWVVEKCKAKKSEPLQIEVDAEIDQQSAISRALFYLQYEAPLSVEGQGGDQTTFAVAASVKDFGVDAITCVKLMGPWNDRCQPPWHFDELIQKVENAYRYGANPIGINAPEKQFLPILAEQVSLIEKHPFDLMNDEYAFVLAGGGHHILWETVDVDGQDKLDHLSELAFHKKFAAHTMTFGDKTSPITSLWMKSPKRRSYSGICFKPGMENINRDWYNLWQGFSIKPVTGKKGESHESVRAFLEHAKENVCDNDEVLFRWLIGYFAHLVQKPWEKPLSAIVFKGAKGVGKNALIDRVGHLIRQNYLVVADKRYLLGNFNSHLENCLLIVLDEAFWSGDKGANGVLKHLTTGDDHVIERKGQEAYKIKNLTRVAIIGNEDWLVPASEDERRYAVFNVGVGRKQDWKYFENMRVGMEKGGYGYLLRYLLDFDLTGFVHSVVPSSKGLLEQKEATLEPFHKWWRECLTQGALVESDFGQGEWPEGNVSKVGLRDAFMRFFKAQYRNAWPPDALGIGKLLTACAPSIKKGKIRDEKSFVPTYVLPTLSVLRGDWEKFLNHKIEWEVE